MLKLLAVTLGIAAYGAYSLYGNLIPTGTAQKPTEVSILQGYLFGESEPNSLIWDTVRLASGLDVLPIPGTGCTESVIPPENLLVLLYSLPEPQRSTVATLLDKSMHLWSAQLYHGEKGVGLCLPKAEQVVILPIKIPEISRSGITKYIDSIVNSRK